MTHNDGVKLKTNSRELEGNLLNLKGKLNAPMNTIMSMLSTMATIRKNLTVRIGSEAATVKNYLTVRQADGNRLQNMTVVKECLTTEAERIATDREDMKELERMEKLLEYKGRGEKRNEKNRV